MKNEKCTRCRSIYLIKKSSPENTSLCLDCGHEIKTEDPMDIPNSVDVEIRTLIRGSASEAHSTKILLDGTDSVIRGSFTTGIAGEYYSVRYVTSISATKFKL